MIPRRRIHTVPHELALALRFSTRSAEFPGADKEFASACARYIGSACAIPMSSGRRGLDCVLAALPLAAGDEVIMPAYTLLDLAVRIQQAGLKPVFADIDPLTMNMDPDHVERSISPRTKVIVATHLFGAPCQIDRIMDIASKHRIFVIEDCAHSIGARFQGKRLGSFGTASFFSFETIKPLNLYGGGMVMTNDPGLAERISGLAASMHSRRGVPLKKIAFAFCERLFLPTPLSGLVLAPLAARRLHRFAYGAYRFGQRCSRPSSSGLTGFQSYLGLLKLKSLDERIRRRQEQAATLCAMLRDPIRPQRIVPGGESNYYFFVVQVPDRAWEARFHLLKKGVDAGVEAEIADDCARAFNDDRCPVTAGVSARALHLPLHEGMTLRQLCHVAESLNAFYS